MPLLPPFPFPAPLQHYVLLLPPFRIFSFVLKRVYTLFLPFASWDLHLLHGLAFVCHCLSIFPFKLNLLFYFGLALMSMTQILLVYFPET